MHKVIIYVPTYRNERIFNACLTSYLCQTYSNIEVHIFDNSAADGFQDIEKLVFKKADPRVRYIKNQSQIGASGNYEKILANFDSTSLGIILASDMALAPNAIEKLVHFKNLHEANVAKASVRNYNISDQELEADFSFENKEFMALDKLSFETRLFSSHELLERYFSEENIKGEFFKFSLFGSLIDGDIVRSLGTGYRRFKFHGGEQYLSMNLLVRSTRIIYIAEELNYNFYGHARLGGTERLATDIGRIECIEACQMIIDENDLFLISNGVNVNRFRASQIDKARYFQEHYKGFNGYPQRVVHINLPFLT
jgi:glycosyltransferase involved in cell wall biosynthesis